MAAPPTHLPKSPNLQSKVACLAWLASLAAAAAAWACGYQNVESLPNLYPLLVLL